MPASKPLPRINIPQVVGSGTAAALPGLLGSTVGSNAAPLSSARVIGLMLKPEFTGVNSLCFCAAAASPGLFGSTVGSNAAPLSSAGAIGMTLKPEFSGVNALCFCAA